MRPRLELDPAGGATSIALEATPWRIGASNRLTVLAKCTLQLVAEGHGLPVAAEPLAAGTVELAPVLPHPQLTLVGHAYAPAGRPCGMQQVRVALERGRTTIFDKSILVYGDRTSPTDFAQPFEFMPLVHERAPGSGWNPVGRVLAKGDPPPNLVPYAPSQPIACFAPIPAGFPARAAIFDAAAVRREGDLLAFGLFDFRWFQDAPFDQWLPPLEGGETLVLEGLSPHVPRLATELPAMLVHASWWHARGAAGRLRMRLGRIDVDVDRGVASLVWRGHFALPTDAAASEIAVRVTTGATSLADIAGGGDDEDDGPVTRAGLPRRVLASLADVSRATLADVSRATLADASRMTLADIDVADSRRLDAGPASSGVLPFRGPPPPTSGPLSGHSPASAATGVMVAPSPTSAATGVLAAPAPTSATTGVLAAPEPVRAAPVVLTREELVARLLDGSLTPEALKSADLAGASLQGADLAGRDLRGARLAGALLDGARLGAARLDDADLSGASMRGVHAEATSLVGANLAGAELGEADLRSARLGRAVLRGAKAIRAKLDDADLAGADLDDLDAQDASLERASMRGARARRARFDRASFREACLDGVDAQEARLPGADLTRSRAAGVRFPRARMESARLDEAAWPEAALDGCSLVGAFLGRATVTRGSFTGADLTRADLREASMQGATFGRAICDAASFDRADLSGADMSGALLNEGALTRARTTGAKLR